MAHKILMTAQRPNSPFPFTCLPKIPAGQQEEGHGVVHHGQEEHHQPYLLRYYQNDLIDPQSSNPFLLLN